MMHFADPVESQLAAKASASQIRKHKAAWQFTHPLRGLIKDRLAFKGSAGSQFR
jgi:hypothetical protein